MEITKDTKAEDAIKAFQEASKRFSESEEFHMLCAMDVMKRAYNRIKEQQAEIYQLQETIIMGRFTSPTAIRAQQSWHRQNSENIKRLNEENEKLQEKLEGMIEAAHIAMKVAEAEAIKGFAERLKKSIKKSVDDAWHSDGNGIYDAENVLDDIDNLVIEMTGAEDNGNTEKDS